MRISYLTTAEEQVMNVLWELDSAYMREILAHYPEPKPHPNTVSTFLKILVEKDFLTTEKEGRIFRYSVAIPYSMYRKFLLINFMEQHFHNSAGELVTMLKEEKLITEKVLKEIVSLREGQVHRRKSEEQESDISEFIDEITAPKKKKVKKIKKKNKEGSRTKKELNNTEKKKKQK